MLGNEMQRDSIQSTVVQTLMDIQSLGGHGVPSITGTTCPLYDLAGFDSITAVEATCMLSSTLGCDVDENLFFSQNPNQPLTVDDIVNTLSKVVSPTPGGSHDRK
jgi:hypothetical protein